MSQKFDVVVIGSGPGGYVCAIRAAQLGFSTAIVEREHLGGICLNWGCIPTKALLKASEVLHTIEHAEEFGITAGKPKVDFKKLIARSRKVADKLSGGIGYLMKKNKITVLEGEGKFKDQNTLTVSKGGTTEEVTFKHAVVATGARAKQIPGVLEADEKNIWTYKTAMVPDQLPKSLLVIGGGAIGVEFANFYHTLGVDVTVVEAQDRLLPVEDAEIAKHLTKALEKRGMKVLVNAKVSDLKSDKEGVSASINGEKQTFDKAILAIGVQGNTENLGLEKLGVKTENGQMKVNDMYQTKVANIYAIGDVVGAPWLAHVASHEGVIAAEHMGHKAGKGEAPHAMRYDNIPGCTYCTPQVASVGLTEQAAKEQNLAVKIGRYSYQANGKAIALGEPEGLVKTIFDANTGELLGAHLVGAEATEMISTFVLGRHMEATEAEFIEACLPHPTLSEMIGESVLDSEDRALNA